MVKLQDKTLKFILILLLIISLLLIYFLLINIKKYTNLNNTYIELEENNLTINQDLKSTKNKLNDATTEISNIKKDNDILLSTNNQYNQIIKQNISKIESEINNLKIELNDIKKTKNKIIYINKTPKKEFSVVKLNINKNSKQKIIKFSFNNEKDILNFLNSSNIKSIENHILVNNDLLFKQYIENRKGFSLIEHLNNNIYNNEIKNSYLSLAYLIEGVYDTAYSYAIKTLLDNPLNGESYYSLSIYFALKQNYIASKNSLYISKLLKSTNLINDLLHNEYLYYLSIKNGVFNYNLENFLLEHIN